MTNVRVKPINELEVKSEVSVNDKILILDSVSEEARLASKDELKGDKGDKGDTGSTGPQGVPGTPGTPGKDGEDGEDGKDGNGITSVTSTKVGKTTTVTMNFDEGDPFSFEVQDGQDGGGGSGSGDVVGPNSSTDGHLAVFDGTTGKKIKDGGAMPTIPTKVSDLANDAGYLTSSTGVTSFNGSTGPVTYTAPVSSVNTQTGAVVLDADDISDSTTTNKFVTATDKTTWSGKQDALTLPATPTQGNLVTWGANNKSLVDGGTIPTGVPSGGNNGDVLTNVSGTPTWSAPSGGDVVVSTQTGNILQSGMKIWAGEETDYGNLGTYDSNTLYLTVE